MYLHWMYKDRSVKCVCVLRVNWDLQDQEERTALRDPRVARVSLETLDLWDPTVKR